MKKMLKKLKQIKYVILITFLAGVLISSQQAYAFETELNNNLETALDSICADLYIIGASAAVIIPDQGTWLGTYGYSDPYTEDSITPDMLFGIGSITKTFISALILKLAQEGFLSLDDTLSKWINQYYKNISPVITIRQLLNHTSGIFNYVESAAFYPVFISNSSRLWTPEEILFNFVEEPYFNPGDNWHYSNTNYIILGMIIKDVTKCELLATQLRQHFIEPLNLNHTFMAIEDTIPDEYEIAHPFLYYNNQFLDQSYEPRQAIFSLAWTAGAMYSSAEDLANWIKALYNGDVLNREYLDEMLDFVETPWIPYGMPGYGLGAIEFDFLDKKYWGHGGNIQGYDSMATYSPYNKISIAVLINESSYMGAEKDVSVALWDVVNKFLSTSIKDHDISYQQFELNQNYPNPFNKQTIISYNFQENSNVILEIFNIKGQKVKTLVNDYITAGYHYSVWDGKDASNKDVANGVFFFKLESEQHTSIKQMMLLK